MEKGTDGYNYLQSASEADYKTNLNTAVRSDYDLIYGIGYKLKDAIEEVSKTKNLKINSLLLMTQLMTVIM